MKRRICNISIFIIITGLFIALALTDFFNSYLRLGEVFQDLGQSIKLYFYMLLGKPYYGDVTIKDYSEVIKNNIKLPETFEGLKGKLGAYFSLLFSKENFIGWLRSVGWFLYDVCYYISFAVFC